MTKKRRSDNDDEEITDETALTTQSSPTTANNNDNSGLPPWLANPVLVEAKSDPTPLDQLKFSLSKRMLSSLAKNDISSLFPVQLATIPLLLRQNTFKWDLDSNYGTSTKSEKNYRNWGTGDLCVAAPTGSGKTLSFVIPILEKLWNRIVPRLRVIVILPTRDLAVQVKESFDAFVTGSDLKVALICGQLAFQAEREKLFVNFGGENGYKSSSNSSSSTSCSRNGNSNSSLSSTKVDIMVCTPGRLMDHLVAGLSLEHLEILVIDEADRLLSQSYQNWLPNLLDRIQKDQYSCSDSLISAFPSDPYLPLLPSPPAPGKTRKWLFSATLTRNPEKLASLALNDPAFVHVTSGGERYSIPDTLKEFMLVCEQEEKLIALLHILKNRFPEKDSKAIIFTNSVETAERLERVLSRIPDISQSFPAVVYGSNGSSSRERRHLLADFESWPESRDPVHGKPVRLLICTDGMARGMDTNTPAVINYDAPGYVKGYLHRIGRCARAGNHGNAYTIVSSQEAFHFKTMLSEKSISRSSNSSLITKIKMPKGNSYESHAAILDQAISQL